ncbi:amino acid adenylation domain-containing protein [Catenulispora sp. NF23]|uniref:Pls/PosA family non-ribosomal peptide synthetase n=1 Tax=Catenulispora pinistramenti TaxID=2705254 RepID=UPI001BA7B72B|nr:Pls/PosA family non-ribosomal peptide synthetase [Catenulispora pinistramenti]MBS2539632.1 amino acid adenylation domain-containing protein [Catenulispora pinistramenti]
MPKSNPDSLDPDGHWNLPIVRWLSQYFERTCDRVPDNAAVLCGTAALSYAELDRRANRLAALLRERGAGPGRHVGILLERSLDSYVALLAVMKSGAAYVPLDSSFPADRVAFIAEDAELCDLVTTSALRHRTHGLPCQVLELDEQAAQVAAQSPDRLAIEADPAQACYIIYTSGTTGRPKGVAVSHASLVNFLQAVAPIYQVCEQDRVYQGLSLAFDFSVEEVWPAWVVGATLVAGPTDDRRVGEGLAAFLVEQAITVLCCVPTLLTAVEAEISSLRSLLVSGEACPPDLVKRWSRPGRRLLNVYGPTEGTVSATWTELSARRPVTIGKPLPSYRVYLLDENLVPVPAGDSGEICIGGPGVAIGYLNRPELTAQKFIANPVLADREYSPRVYRTGDLGRFTPAGEIEFLGRIDTQVKIRGYRIELAEIEQVLREDPAVENAVVVPRENDGVVQDLVGYLTLANRSALEGERAAGDNGARHITRDTRDTRDTRNDSDHNHNHDSGPADHDDARHVTRDTNADADSGRDAADRDAAKADTGPASHADHDDLRERLHTKLRSRLPDYMIPSFVEVLSALPMLAADKVDRAALPAPTSPPLAKRSRPHVAASTPTEQVLVAAWRDILGVQELSVEDDFFLDLGGHSMAAARLMSRLRKQPETAGLAMADLYSHPTVSALAALVDDASATAGAPSDPQQRQGPQPRRHSSLRVAVCGFAQVAALYAWLMVFGLPALVLLYRLLASWHQPMPGLGTSGDPLDYLARMSYAEFVPLEIAWTLLDVLLIPAVGCRLLLAGVKPGWYPLWGPTYFRFWFATKVMTGSAAALLAGSPLLPPLLRAMGAKIGRGCHIAGPFGLPKFVELGDNVSVGYGARVQSYAIEGGWLRLAPVRLDEGSNLGTNSVLLPGSTLGAHATLGEQSLLPADHTVPAGEHWAGSPASAQESAPAILQVLAERPDERRWPVRLLAGYALGALVLILVPLVIAAAGGTMIGLVAWQDGFDWSLPATLVAGPVFVLATCLLIIAVKRAVLPRVRPGIYAERSGFGVRKWIGDGLMTTSLTLTHSLYSTLYLVPFLRRLGARTGRWSEVATVSFVDPDMLVIGERSFVADVAVVAPAVFHRGRIAIAQAEVGERSFVGNGALLPGSGRMGDNSLLGVHSVAPTRPIDPETTWLGSPAIFLPRREESQQFPAKYTYDPSPGLIAARLAIEYARVTLPSTIGALSALGALYTSIKIAQSSSPLTVFLLAPALVLGAGFFATLLVVLIKWLVIGRYRQRVEPLWGVWVRRTELVTGLFENLVVPGLLNFLTGTPLAPWVMRLFGARFGRRVWLNTTYMTEFDLVAVGDDAAVGELTSLQTHLFEDRVMKMSTVVVGRGGSVGARSVVLYDAEVGEDTTLDALSLVMKGEHLPGQSRWRGIPARRF